MATRHNLSDSAAHARRGGFTLIELIVAVAIVGILLAVALPGYTRYIQKARRADAKNALLDLAARQERFFSVNNSYTTSPAKLGYTANTAAAFPLAVQSGNQSYYQLDVPSAAASAYNASAQPLGAQAGDPCGTYLIDQLGAQSNSGGTLASTSCW